MEKLENKNTDVFILNNSATSEKTIFLLNSCGDNGSFIPLAKDTEECSITLEPDINSRQELDKQVDEFIKKVSEYAEDSDFIGEPTVELKSTRLGKILRKLIQREEIEDIAGEIQNEPKVIFTDLYY